MDRKWWHAYSDELKGDAEHWTSNPEASRIHNLNFVRSEPGGGLSPLAGVIRQGGNSGFQALGLALLFGASKVVLLGYDMQLTGGKTHWHGDHKGKDLGNPVADRTRKWLAHFNLLASQTPIPIINATRQSALKCFPRQELNASLSEPAPLSPGKGEGVS